MSLTSDLYNAFKKATKSEEPGPELQTMSEEVADSIVNWMTAQTFTITELKASLEVEDLKLSAPINTNTLAPINGIPNTGGPVVIPPSPIVLNPFNFSKTGGQGGSMMSTGHAYIGKKANKIPGADTAEEFNNFTKVKLDPNKVVDK